MPLDTESWGPDSCAGVKPTPLPLQTVLQHYIHYRSHTVTCYVVFLYYSGSCIDTFIVLLYAQLDAPLVTKWIYIKNWTRLKNTKLRAMLPFSGNDSPHSPSLKNVQKKNLLQSLNILFQHFLHVSEFCKLRTSNASEVNKSLSYSYTILQ